jgi:hypothetical protein
MCQHLPILIEIRQQYRTLCVYFCASKRLGREFPRHHKVQDPNSVDHATIITLRKYPISLYKRIPTDHIFLSDCRNSAFTVYFLLHPACPSSAHSWVLGSSAALFDHTPSNFPVPSRYLKAGRAWWLPCTFSSVLPNVSFKTALSFSGT